MEIKTYLPIRDKLNIVELVSQNNSLMREIMLGYCLLKYYSDVLDEVSDGDIDVLDIFDEYSQNGKLEEVKSQISKSEIDFLSRNIKKRVHEKTSIGFVVGDFLEKLIEKIPDEEGMENLIEQFNNISPENKKLIQNIFKTETRGRKKKSGAK